MKCSCGYNVECGVWCGLGHENGMCPPYIANNDVQPPKPPQCGYCGEYAPYGDVRHLWIDRHHAWSHRLYWRVKGKLS